MRQLRTEVYNLHDDIAICQKRLVTDENKIKVMGSRWARDKRTLMCFRYYFLKGIVEDAITEYKSWCATECSLYSDVVLMQPFCAHSFSKTDNSFSRTYALTRPNMNAWSPSDAGKPLALNGKHWTYVCISQYRNVLSDRCCNSLSCSQFPEVRNCWFKDASTIVSSIHRTVSNEEVEFFLTSQ